MRPNTVFIAKAERLLCDALCLFCEANGLQVIGSSTDGKETLNLLGQLRPKFAIIDASLPNISGFQIVSWLNSHNPQVKCVLYLKQKDSDHLRTAMDLNLKGLLFANDELSNLAKCLNTEALEPDNTFRNSNALDVVSDPYTSVSGDPLHTLTPTQLKILSLVSTHKTMPQMAKELFISPHTVNNHISNIRKKLNLQGRGEILKYALANKNRLIEVNGKVLVTESRYRYSWVA